MAFLLPYVEQQPLYDQLDFGKNTRQSPNAELAGILIPGYCCPSDPHSTERITTSPKHARDFMNSVPATTPRSYFASGPVRSGFASNGYVVKTTGEGYMDSDARKIRTPATIIDGLSNTLAYGEGMPDCYNWSGWMYGDASLFSTANGINVANETLCCRSKGANWNEWTHCPSFRSLHPGGMNAGVADASVHWISSTIDMDVFTSMGTIDGGEVVSVP